MSKTHETGRNATAVAAQFRTSAGVMKDKRVSRGGSRNANRDFLAEYEESMELTNEPVDFTHELA